MWIRNLVRVGIAAVAVATVAGVGSVAYAGGAHDDEQEVRGSAPDMGAPACTCRRPA